MKTLILHTANQLWTPNKFRSEYQLGLLREATPNPSISTENFDFLDNTLIEKFTIRCRIECCMQHKLTDKYQQEIVESVLFILTCFWFNILTFPRQWFLMQYFVNFRRKPSGNSPFTYGSHRKISEIRCKGLVTVSGCRYWQTFVDSGRNRINPVTRSVHRDTASMKSVEKTWILQVS